MKKIRILSVFLLLPFLASCTIRDAEVETTEIKEEVISDEGGIKVVKRSDGSFVEMVKDSKRSELPVMLPDNFVFNNRMYKFPLKFGFLLDQGFNLVGGSIPDKIEAGEKFKADVKKDTLVFSLELINDSKEVINKSDLKVLSLKFDIDNLDGKNFYMGNLTSDISYEKFVKMYEETIVKNEGVTDGFNVGLSTANDRAVTLKFNKEGKLLMVKISDENTYNTNNKDFQEEG